MAIFLHNKWKLHTYLTELSEISVYDWRYVKITTK